MSPIENRDALLERVVRRGTELRRRRQLMGAGAALSVVVLVGVAVAFTDNDEATEVAAGQSTTTTFAPTTTSVLPMTTPTTEGGPVTTIPGVQPAPTTVATVPGGGTTTTTGVQPGCRNSTDMACGPAYWDPAPATNQPMTVRVTPSTPAPKVGEPVTFTVVVSDPDARIDRECNSLIVYGDGQGVPACATTASCVARFGAWTPPERRPDRYEATFTHTYATAGDATASFTFTSTSGICGPDDPYGSIATGRVVLQVTA